MDLRPWRPRRRSNEPFEVTDRDADLSLVLWTDGDLDRRDRDDELLRAVHEIRSPLATIGVAASTLRRRRDVLDEPTQDRLLAEIERSVEALRNAVDHLLGNAAVNGTEEP